MLLYDIGRTGLGRIGRSATNDTCCQLVSPITAIRHERRRAYVLVRRVRFAPGPPAAADGT